MAIRCFVRQIVLPRAHQSLFLIGLENLGRIDRRKQGRNPAIAHLPITCNLVHIGGCHEYYLQRRHYLVKRNQSVSAPSLKV